MQAEKYLAYRRGEKSSPGARTENLSTLISTLRGQANTICYLPFESVEGVHTEVTTALGYPIPDDLQERFGLCEGEWTWMSLHNPADLKFKPASLVFFQGDEGFDTAKAVIELQLNSESNLYDTVHISGIDKESGRVVVLNYTQGRLSKANISLSPDEANFSQSHFTFDKHYFHRLTVTDNDKLNKKADIHNEPYAGIVTNGMMKACGHQELIRARFNIWHPFPDFGTDWFGFERIEDGERKIAGIKRKTKEYSWQAVFPQTLVKENREPKLSNPLAFLQELSSYKNENK